RFAPADAPAQSRTEELVAGSLLKRGWRSATTVGPAPSVPASHDGRSVLRAGQGTCAEDGGADADDRGTLGDGPFEIAAHSHRELAEVDVRTGEGGLAVAQRAQPGEVGARLVGVFGE